MRVSESGKVVSKRSGVGKNNQPYYSVSVAVEGTTVDGTCATLELFNKFPAEGQRCKFVADAQPQKDFKNGGEKMRYVFSQVELVEPAPQQKAA